MSDNRKIADDNPEWTAEELAAARPAAEVLPAEVIAAFGRKRGQRGPGKRPARRQVTLRLSPETLDAFKARGAGWQGRIDAALARFITEHPDEV